MLIGSAGNYAYGTIDPIPELSDLAVEHGTYLHVDALPGRLHPALGPGARGTRTSHCSTSACPG